MLTLHYCLKLFKKFFSAFVRSIRLKKCDRSSSPGVHDYFLEVIPPFNLSWLYCANDVLLKICNVVLNG